MQIPLAASLPISSLESLGDLRSDRRLQVVIEANRVWLAWDSPNPSLVHRLMAIPDAQLFSRETGGWTLIGSRVPTFDLPLDNQEKTSLVHQIIPIPIEPIAPGSTVPRPVQLQLVRDASSQARPPSVLIASLDALAKWVELALSSEFRQLWGATSGQSVIVRGSPLPPIAGASRFWGIRVLCPLGFRLVPTLPESAIRRSLSVDEDDLIIFHGEENTTYETVPLPAFSPLSRASIRMAIREAART